jgi:hypothetical protein
MEKQITASIMVAIAQAGTSGGLAARPRQANWNLTDAQATKGKDAKIMQERRLESVERDAWRDG